MRPRLREQPVRWFESRSPGDLEGFVSGLACPLVVIEVGRDHATALEGLGRIRLDAPGARILVLDPEAVEGFALLARELGATHVFSGFVPPPVVAELLFRWVTLSCRDLERAGWSRATPPDSQAEPWSWLFDDPGEPDASSDSGTAPRPT
jgi:hypothetical protein